MKLRGLAALLLVLMLAAPAATWAQVEEDVCSIAYLFNAWARSSPEGAPNGAVFGLLVNLGSEADTLLGASTEAAEVVELHETIMAEKDVMQMRPVEGGMMIPPGSFLELQPGGLHIMLINLKAPLEAGEMLNLVLNFEQAGEVQLAVPIRDMEAMDEAMSEEMSAPAMDMPAVEWDEACQKMHVVDAWARPAVPGMPNSAAYALLLNLTAADDVLTSASTDAAETVELHEMIMGEGDVMQMRPVEGGIAVPAGRATLLKPGGLHVMLIGLTDELAEGTTFDATLTFAESGEIPLTIPVRQPEESGMAGGMGEHGGSEGG